MNEMELLNKIRLALQEKNIVSFRCNVGKVRTPDGRYFDTGLPKGFSDLLAILPDGKACFIETKLHPRKPTKEQCQFLLSMMKHGCAAGVAFTVQEALNIVDWNDVNALESEINVSNYLRSYK